MFNDTDYTPDQKFITVNRRGSELEKVPVSLLDEIWERGLSSYDLERLLWFRAVTRDAQKAEWLKMRDLVGQDLADKTVHFWHANYEDSEWRSVTGPLTVKAESDDWASFVLPDHIEHWWNNMAEEEELPREEYWKYQSAFGASFYMDETVLVVTETQEGSDDTK